MPQKNLSLSLWGTGFRIRCGFPQLKRSFDVDVRALGKTPEVGVGGWVKGENVMPSCFSFKS